MNSALDALVLLVPYIAWAIVLVGMPVAIVFAAFWIADHPRRRG